MPVKELLLLPLWANRKACDFPCLSTVVSASSCEESFPRDHAMKWGKNLISCGEKWDRAKVLWNRSVELHYIFLMVNESQTVNCEFLKIFCFVLSTSRFSSTPLPSTPFLLFIWRPSRGGQTWWWNMPRPSCVSTQLTWTQLLKSNHLIVGTVFLSSSCSTTSWGWTVSEELVNYIQLSALTVK